MAAKNHKTVTVNGVEVTVDLAYVQSWEGIRKGAFMNSPQHSDGERGVAMVEYFERAIANIDDINEAMASEAADKVMALLDKAITEATPKN